MIDEIIKEALGYATMPALKGSYLCILANAYVQAEARARMAEFEAEHSLDEDGICRMCPKHSRDSAHKKRFGDYVAEVEAELSNG